MKQSETDAEATGPSPISSVHGNLSVCEAKAFWQNQHAEGKVDLIFEKVQNKLQLLWQKIKDGSATNQEYTRALLWVSEADFDDSETYNCDLNIADELKEDKNCTPAWREEMLSIPINYELSTCACLQLTARECNKNITSTKNGVKPGYTYKRLTTPISTGLYECNVSCKCDRKMCQNRVVQHGLQVRLQVYKTKDKGWGVRCLDDLEKGTFVCIYAGRILLKSVDVNAEQDSNVYVMQTDGNKTTSIYSKRKRVSHSDSEINVLPSVSTSNQKHGDSPTVSGCGQPKMSKKSVCSSRGKLDFTSIRRPKTKTSMLQKRRRQLMEEGAVTLQHSSDDDLSTPPASPKLLHFNEPGDKQNDGKRDRRVHTAERDTVQTDEAGYVSDESSSSIRLGVSHLQQSTCREKKVPLDSSLEENENTCILDASKEGNVGRFLNHSCSPNLLVQQVFVETHCKSFPWVAFFTKSIVKAGTELTWEYNYHIGSAPENEIPCLCGHKTCKNITI
ncbi:histone-lysine N-methyltransferase SETDB2 isoform X2 [Mixophyes fleayi]|uniref:histone-lysine N-methyltransferase SETDB2 isoform X2 n=1 Tax=Mixophyes fleayi TaxID=3061075 RepID=UPI003F4E3AAE